MPKGAYLFEGVILDRAGPSRDYLVLSSEGQVLERGRRGTLGRPRGWLDRIRGIAIPPPFNGHTHLGDAGWPREPPSGTVEEIVAPPHGLKHRWLSRVSLAVKREGIEGALDEMRELGIAGTIDFREEGRPGIRLLRNVSEREGFRCVILGRPRGRAQSPQAVRQILAEADGIGLSALRDVPRDLAELAAAECRRSGKILALHASESEREPIDSILALRPRLLVHLCAATPSDLDAVAQEGVEVAVCPRSNALFGRQPPLAEMERRHVRLLLGTDNGMLVRPDLYREMAFAYYASRLRGQPVRPETLVRAAFLEPWEFLGEPDRAQITADPPARPLVFRLPETDPWYQICCRASTRYIHVLSRRPSSGRRPSRGRRIR
jgi:cytosine/adenosine deaminase-related metal-dependent hydrolase